MLTLRFKKVPDAHASLTVVRTDGSSDCASIGPAEGFGPVHDLAHAVVESQLNLSGGFLGLLAQGAAFAEFDRGALARIGVDAVRAEAIAGLLSLEAMTGHRLTLMDFNDTVATKCGEMRPGYRPMDLTPTVLHAMRAELASLRRRWLALEPGESLELQLELLAPGRRSQASDRSTVT